MLQLRSCQLTLLTSLAFGAVLAVFSAPLTAQTTQDLPKTIPNLSGYDGETRHTIEIACISERIHGPVAYGACLNRQIASLQRSPGIPNLSGYDDETRHTIEIACISERIHGPVAYGACLNRQIASLQRSPGIPNLSVYDGETRHTIEIACISERIHGPVAYGACLNRQIASLQKNEKQTEPQRSSSTRNVSLWHIADISALLRNVCFRRTADVSRRRRKQSLTALLELANERLLGCAARVEPAKSRVPQQAVRGDVAVFNLGPLLRCGPLVDLVLPVWQF